MILPLNWIYSLCFISTDPYQITMNQEAGISTLI